MRFLIQIQGSLLPLWQGMFCPNILPSSSLGEDTYFVESDEFCNLESLWKTIFPRFVMNIVFAKNFPVRSFSLSEYIDNGTQVILEAISSLNLSLDQKPSLIVFGTKVWLTKRARKISDKLKNVFGSYPISGERFNSLINSKPSWIAAITEDHIFIGTARTITPLDLLSGRLSPFTACPNKSKGTASRAGLKFREAWQLLIKSNAVPLDSGTWLDLGAAPGGITEELLKLNFKVLAMDKANLDQSILIQNNLRFIKGDILTTDFSLLDHEYSGIVCDVNMRPQQIVPNVLKASQYLKVGSPLIFTLKLASWNDIKQDLSYVIDQFQANCFTLLDIRHLFHNRQELTVLGIKGQAPIKTSMISI